MWQRARIRRDALPEEVAGACLWVHGPPIDLPAGRAYENAVSGDWTLVVVGRPVREWGFWPKGRWVPWFEYVGSRDAIAAKACD